MSCAVPTQLIYHDVSALAVFCTALAVFCTALAVFCTALYF